MTKSISSSQQISGFVIWFLLAGFFLGAGGGIIALFSLPYDRAKEIADLISKDGSLELFSQELYSSGRHLWILGLGLLVSFGGMVVKRQKTQEIITEQIERLQNSLSIFISDSIILWRAIERIFTNRWEMGMLIGILFVSILNKVVFLSKPMGHDEAYTVMAFAIRPLFSLIADYHLPNNHVLHTILVHLSLFFGKQPWIVRFPSFVAGVLLAPASYIAARQIFRNPRTVLLSAALIGIAPALTAFSSNARGYTLLCLFTLVMLGSGSYIRRYKNLAGWVILTLCFALGLYTIPIMIYPAGMVYGWLFLSAWVGDISEAYNGKLNFLKFIVLSGIFGVLISLTLYTPVLIVSGSHSLFNNAFVAPLSWTGFVAGLSTHLGKTWMEWTEGIPGFVVGVSVICFLTALFFHGKLTGQRFPFPVAAFCWVVALLYYQRVAPISRIWLFALPFYLMYAAAGFVFLTDKLLQWIGTKEAWRSGVFGVSMTALVLWSMQGTFQQYQESQSQPFGRMEQFTLTLCEILYPKDAVLIYATNAPILRYYFYRYGIPDEHLFPRDNPLFRQIYVVVDESERETLESVIERQHFKDIIEPHTTELVFSKENLTLYQIQPTVEYRTYGYEEPLTASAHCP